MLREGASWWNRRGFPESASDARNGRKRSLRTSSAERDLRSRSGGLRRNSAHSTAVASDAPRDHICGGPFATKSVLTKREHHRGIDLDWARRVAAQWASAVVAANR